MMWIAWYYFSLNCTIKGLVSMINDVIRYSKKYVHVKTFCLTEQKYTYYHMDTSARFSLLIHLILFSVIENKDFAV